MIEVLERKKQDRAAIMRKIIKDVAKAFNVKPSLLLSKNQNGIWNDYRDVMFLILKEKSGLEVKVIARGVDRDEKTIYTASKRARDKMAANPQLKEIYEKFN